ncbi:MAG: cryptochrome/photolyase family protein [Gemmatimonadaceae bacterium]|nr:cryptochrome/photolyase family protein [Gemmatimonadaceae bacterium]
MPRPTIAFVAPWECSRAVAHLPAEPRDDVIVLFLESVGKGCALPWHRQKLVLVLSAMQHFARELEDAGYRVVMRRADHYADGLVAAAREFKAGRIVLSEGREQDHVDELALAEPQLAALRCTMVRRADRGFIATRDAFTTWAEGKRERRMEFFYRELRRAHDVLMDGAQPVGGRWNFDAENRKPWPKGKPVPPPFAAPPDALTREIMTRVDGWRGRFGRAEGFALPVARADAQAWLTRFIDERLAEFGPYEDALVHGAGDLLHSTLSSLINVGLLHPMEAVRAAETAWRDGRVPLASAEGFIRQLLGWREFIRGMYWLLMPGLRSANALEAREPLPHWFWAPDGEAYELLAGDGSTRAQRTGAMVQVPAGPACAMRCLHDTLVQVRERGRVHHIARLMVQCNFATLLGVEPAVLSQWYWSAFTDAYEWVELPNVAGMGTWGDGGAIGSKPYVSSGAYIDRMSDYCGSCRYDVTQRTGPDACPFNLLYWDFLATHRERFARHPRMSMMVRHLDRMPEGELVQLRREASAFRDAVARRETT